MAGVCEGATTPTPGQSHLKALPLDGGGLGGGDRAASPVRSGCQAANSPPPRPSPIMGEGVSRPDAIALPRGRGREFLTTLPCLRGREGPAPEAWEGWG